MLDLVELEASVNNSWAEMEIRHATVKIAYIGPERKKLIWSMIHSYRGV